MDIYEFTRALRRQWILLVVGLLALVVGVFAAMFEVSRVDGAFSVESRITPKYESSVELVVVPAGLESLASRSVGGGSAEAARVYGEMLVTEEAARQIEETQGIDLIDTLRANAADSFIEVTATAETPEAAAAGALGAFRWLEGRLAQPPVLARLPQEEEEVTEPEEFLGNVSVEVDRLYATADPALTLVIGNFQGDEVAVPLQNAAGNLQSRLTYLMPQTIFTLSVEREVGVALDSATIEIPPLPKSDEGPPPLVMSVEWGAVSFDEVELDEEGEPLEPDPANPPGAQIDPSRISLRWDSAAAPPQDERVSLMLITEDVTALETGQRRTPVMVAGLLTVGVLVLLVLAVTIDTWQMAKVERRGTRPGERALSLEEGRQRLHVASAGTDTATATGRRHDRPRAADIDSQAPEP